MDLFSGRCQLGRGLFGVHSDRLQLGILHLVAGFLCTGCLAADGSCRLWQQPPCLWNFRRERIGSTAKAAAARGLGRAIALGKCLRGADVPQAAGAALACELELIFNRPSKPLAKESGGGRCGGFSRTLRQN